MSVHQLAMGRLGLAAAALAAAALLTAGCRAPSAAPQPRARQDAIPKGAIKWTPEQDPSRPILHSSEWMQPVPVEGPVNTAGAEDSPFILPDGSSLYLFFTPDVQVPPEKQLFDGVTGIYESKKQNGRWTDPQRVRLQDSGKLALDGCEFVQGDTMWFCSAREGYAGISLFTAEFKNGKWQDWKYAGDKLNKEYQVGEMHITADGRGMYFHSPRSGGRGEVDIWMTRRTGDAWGPPENVQAVNTAGTEGWPFTTSDGNELWFTRTYKGTPAVFRAKRAGDKWSAPELIVSQFAGEPTLDNAGNLYFVHHYYKDGKMQEADIYVASRKR